MTLRSMSNWVKMNTTSLSKDIVNQLTKVCKTKVTLDEIVDDKNKIISVSRTKLSEIIKRYAKIYELVNKCWSNLPPPPCTEGTYVFIWMMISDNYGVNHTTIEWSGSTPNTFVHLWSIMDRIKLSLEETGLYWIVGDRSCTGYYRETGLTGPLDQMMYIPETEPLPCIDDMDDELFRPSYTDDPQEFCSFLDFCTSVKDDMKNEDNSLDEVYISMQLRKIRTSRGPSGSSPSGCP